MAIAIQRCWLPGTGGWVAMARHWLILSEDRAMSVGKVFRCLPGFWDATKIKMTDKVPKLQNGVQMYVCIYIYIYI